VCAAGRRLMCRQKLGANEKVHDESDRHPRYIVPPLVTLGPAGVYTDVLHMVQDTDLAGNAP